MSTPATFYHELYVISLQGCIQICEKGVHLKNTKYITKYIGPGSHGHGKSWKMKKIKSSPGKVMENENLAKSHGKVM